MSVPRVRFAPSPTGPLHIGGVRTALYNYLLARKHGGVNILRIEDTDQGRFVPGAEEYIIEALSWVGISFDEGPHVGGPHAPYRQSERKAIYRQYADELVEKGHAYYAFDSEEELEGMRKRMEAAGMKSPQYNAVTREMMANSTSLPADEVNDRLASGVPYVIRFRMPHREEVRFHDSIRGWVIVNTAQLDDKVLLKSDGMPTYHLANIVDDHLMAITHVIRGEEWLPSTPLHVLLYAAFGWQPPEFAHLPLLLRPDGNGKLSKRDGDQLGFPVFPLQWKDPFTGEISSGYRERGFLPEAVVNFLALLGWHDSTDQELYTLPELITAFTVERVGKSGTKFDFNKALWFNQHYLRHRPSESLLAQVRTEMAGRGWPVPDEARLLRAIDLLKERASLLTELLADSEFLFVAPSAFSEQEVRQKFNGDAAAVLQALPPFWQSVTDWTASETQHAFQAAAASVNLKPGKAQAALRLAVTGVGTGPELFPLLAYLGKEEALKRLSFALTMWSGQQ